MTTVAEKLVHTEADKGLSSSLASLSAILARLRIDSEAGLSGIRGWARTRNAIVNAENEIGGVLGLAMMNSFMRGALFTFAEARRAGISIAASEKAAEFLRKRSKLSTQQLKQMRQHFGREASQVADAIGRRAQRGLDNTLADVAARGINRREAKRLVREEYARQGIAPKNKFAVEANLRTQQRIAFQSGREAGYDDPIVNEALWGFLYRTAGDSRVRPTHAAMDGVKAPKNDPLWTTWTPPNGWACRCIKIALFDGPGKGKRKDVPLGVAPDTGFSFHPKNAHLRMVELLKNVRSTRVATIPIPQLPFLPRVGIQPSFAPSATTRKIGETDEAFRKRMKANEASRRSKEKARLREIERRRLLVKKPPPPPAPKPPSGFVDVKERVTVRFGKQPTPEEFVKSLTPIERQALTRWTGGESVSFIRSGTASKEQLDAFYSMLNKAPQKSGTVFRGDQLLKGTAKNLDEVTFDGPHSFTSKVLEAQEFAADRRLTNTLLKRTGEFEPVVYKVKGTKNLPNLSRTGQFADQGELVTSGKFRVVKTETIFIDGNPGVQITLEPFKTVQKVVAKPPSVVVTPKPPPTILKPLGRRTELEAKIKILDAQKAERLAKLMRESRRKIGETDGAFLKRMKANEASLRSREKRALKQQIAGLGDDVDEVVPIPSVQPTKVTKGKGRYGEGKPFPDEPASAEDFEPWLEEWKRRNPKEFAAHRLDERMDAATHLDIKVKQLQAEGKKLQDLENASEAARINIRKINDDLRNRLDLGWEARDSHPLVKEASKKYKDALSAVSSLKVEAREKFLQITTKNRPSVRKPMQVRSTVKSKKAVFNKNMEEASDFLDRSFQARKGTIGHEVVVQKKSGRAFSQGNKIQLSSSHTTKTFVHEMVHQIENGFDDLYDTSAAFRRRRAKLSPPERRNTMRFNEVKSMKNSGYSADEKGILDQFDKYWDGKHEQGNAWYAGKVYNHKSTEILTMGIETLYSDPLKFATKDPDYVKFLLGVMDGTF